MFCRFCGTENDDSYQHCKKCGKPLGFPEKQKEETKAVTVVAVSYTHLDVYKRQIFERTETVCQ